jgi:hypothetical protein
MTVYLNITYNIETDSFTFESDLKPERRADVLEDFLRLQIGKGKDETPPADLKEYHIRLTLDLTCDMFHVRHDCGNLGLRDGLILHAIHQLQKGKERAGTG